MSHLDGIERIALLLVLSGLTTIYVASLVATPPMKSVQEIGQDEIGTVVRIPGTVKNYAVSDKTAFFRIYGQNSGIKAVHFDGSLPISDGERYVFEGRVKLYEGELELVVDDVANISSRHNQG